MATPPRIGLNLTTLIALLDSVLDCNIHELYP